MADARAQEHLIVISGYANSHVNPHAAARDMRQQRFDECVHAHMCVEGRGVNVGAEVTPA